MTKRNSMSPKKICGFLLLLTAVMTLSSCQQIEKYLNSFLPVSSSSSIEETSVSSSSNSSVISSDSSSSSASEAVSIYYLDLYGKPGDCAVIKTGDIEILVDAGDNDVVCAGKIDELLDTLVTDGKIEYAIATHPDTDHYAGFFHVFERYNVETLFKYATKKSGATLTQFDNVIVNEGCNVNLITSWLGTDTTKTLSINDDTRLIFYNTGSYLTGTNSNDSSIVFTLEAFDMRIVFSGDAGTGPESIYAPLCGDADIYSMGHHGSDSATSRTLLNNVKPEIVIAQVGDYLGNSYSHPTYAALARVYAYNTNTKVYCMAGGNRSGSSIDDDRNGTITVNVNKESFSISSKNYGDSPLEMRETAYWENESNPYRDTYK